MRPPVLGDSQWFYNLSKPGDPVTVPARPWPGRWRQRLRGHTNVLLGRLARRQRQRAVHHDWRPDARSVSEDAAQVRAALETSRPAF